MSVLYTPQREDKELDSSQVCSLHFPREDKELRLTALKPPTKRHPNELKQVSKEGPVCSLHCSKTDKETEDRPFSNKTPYQ
jgi:hypothetical protein